MNRNYNGVFSSWDDVRSNYQGDCPTQEPEYVFAEYETPAYEGYSTVITSMDGKRFHLVEGSHCSCYGLEDQWTPTEHDAIELRKMMEADCGFFHDNKVALGMWLQLIRV